MAQLNFDARTVVPDTGQQDPVPAGWYKVVIDKSEMKPTKDGTGMRLELQFKIIDGQYVNRKIFEGLNLQNANVVAQEIAYKQLSAIAHAVNVLLVEDSTQLHNIPLQIKVNLQAATAQYEAKNSVKAYKNINEVITPVGAPAAPGAPASFAPPAPAAFAPPAGAPAWAPPTAAAAAPAAWAPPAAAQPWAPPAGAPAQAPAAALAAPAQAPAQAPAPAAAPAPALAAPAWAAPPAAVAAAAAQVAPPAAAVAPVTPPWATPAA